MKRFTVLILLLSIVILAIPAGAQDDGEMPTFADLNEGWNLLIPGGDTICSNGTDYSFYVRPADPEKLVIYLEGGGACWFGEICDLMSSPTYDPTVDESDDPTQADGIFAFDNEANPFAEYSFVFIPYCTGDVHIGNSVTTYTVAATSDMEEHEVTIYHNGYTNVMTVLDWVYGNFEAPTNIFVSGSSAGSIPSPFYTAFVAEQYPDASIIQMGDASGGYRADVKTPFEMWDTMSILPDFPEYADVTLETLTFETFYRVGTTRYPDITFTEYNAAHDETQYFFLTLIGIMGTPLPDQLADAFADINEVALDNFFTYTAGGDLHTILGRPEFYTYQVDGLLFSDWVTDLATDEPIENVACAPDACSKAEVAE